MHYARDLRSNNNLLIKPCQSISRLKTYADRSPQHAGAAPKEWNKYFRLYLYYSGKALP